MFSQLVPDGGQLLAVTAPRGVELNQDILYNDVQVNYQVSDWSGSVLIHALDIGRRIFSYLSTMDLNQETQEIKIRNIKVLYFSTH